MNLGAADRDPLQRRVGRLVRAHRRTSASTCCICGKAPTIYDLLHAELRGVVEL